MKRDTLRPVLASIAFAALVVGCATGSNNLPASLSSLGSLMQIGQATTPTSAMPPGTAASGAAEGILKASPEAESELLPDRTCSRPLEKFDISQKAAEYAGTAAQLRLQHLVSSDFQYSQLTPDDKKFLRFLAMTTVWVPLTVENAVARAVDTASGKSTRLKPMQVSARNAVQVRLKTFEDQATGFPGDVKFEVNDGLADGIYAQLGGIITTSPVFLGLMNENAPARDLVLSHELSHVYKRHRLKQLQMQLIETSAGFNMAKSLMGNALGSNANNPFATASFLAVNGTALITFVREHDLQFSKDQELEADACAAVWMERAQVDLCEAWNGFKQIAPKEGAYALTHPTNEEREENYYRKVNGTATVRGSGCLSAAAMEHEVNEHPSAVGPASGSASAPATPPSAKSKSASAAASASSTPRSPPKPAPIRHPASPASAPASGASAAR